MPVAVASATATRMPFYTKLREILVIPKLGIVKIFYCSQITDIP